MTGLILLATGVGAGGGRAQAPAVWSAATADLRAARIRAEIGMRDAEIFATFAALEGARYPTETIERWRGVLRSARSSSTPSDEARRDLLRGYREAASVAADILARALGYLESRIASPYAPGRIAWNSLVHGRDALVEGRTVAREAGPAYFLDVPGMGYRCDAAPSAGIRGVRNGTILENEWLRLVIDPDRGGSITSLVDRRVDRELLRAPALDVVSIPQDRRSAVQGRARVLPDDDAHPYRIELECDFDGFVIRQRIELPPHAARVDVRTEIRDWRGLDEALRIEFPFDLSSPRVLFPDEPGAESAVAALASAGSDRGIVLAGAGSADLTVRPDGTASVELLRSAALGVDQRSFAPEGPRPAALHGSHVFSWSLAPFGGPVSVGAATRAARESLSPLIVRDLARRREGSLPAHLSFLTFDAPDVHVSALSPWFAPATGVAVAPALRGVEVRLENEAGRAVEVGLRLHHGSARAWRAGPDGRPGDELELADGAVHVALPANASAIVLVEIARAVPMDGAVDLAPDQPLPSRAPPGTATRPGLAAVVNAAPVVAAFGVLRATIHNPGAVDLEGDAVWSAPPVLWDSLGGWRTRVRIPAGGTVVVESALGAAPTSWAALAFETVDSVSYGAAVEIVADPTDVSLTFGVERVALRGDGAARVRLRARSLAELPADASVRLRAPTGGSVVEVERTRIEDAGVTTLTVAFDVTAGEEDAGFLRADGPGGASARVPFTRR